MGPVRAVRDGGPEHRGRHRGPRGPHGPGLCRNRPRAWRDRAGLVPRTGRTGRRCPPRASARGRPHGATHVAGRGAGRPPGRTPAAPARRRPRAMTRPVRFTFDGADIAAAPGASLAAALTAAGVRGFRETETGSERGIFCGMGVCQDCLVTVDGRPGRRACMTAAAEGLDVRRQPARPPLTPPPATTLTPVLRTPQVLVLGGGAGGLTAAIAAREAGAEVLLLDERTTTGGQYFKQASGSVPPLDAQQAEGARLVSAARAAGVEMLHGAEVWGAFPGPRILAADAAHVYDVAPRALIVATGAYERPLMIPGWTEPGVMTVGAAQTLWRSYRTLPGRRVAVFGNGPLSAQVALELARGGAEIAFLGEAAPDPLRRPGATFAMLRHDPRLAAKGAAMLAALARRGVRVAHGTRPTRIARQDATLTVSWEGPRGAAEAEVDAVCLSFGFHPQNEVLRLLAAQMRFDPRFEQLRPERDETCATTVPGVWAVGDCCGLGGAPAAAVEGRIAGRAAAGGGGPTAAERRALARHRGFQDALWRLYAATTQRIEDMAPDTLICRCEEVPRSALDASLDAGCEDIGAVKRATRIGMGRCQGRYCAPALAGYLARRAGADPVDAGYFAPRVPVKPVDIATLTAAEPLLAADADADAADG
ncbi:FAD-dependent oxidoreductase [Rhodobacteraceae bacterium CCMM004]|nr:FAD-dependent oxidoreductase [Rhodobacteraceae bacterium CCMM004]